MTFWKDFTTRAPCRNIQGEVGDVAILSPVHLFNVKALLGWIVINRRSHHSSATVRDFFQELTWTEKIPKRGTSKLYWFRGTTQTFSWIEVNIMSFHRLVIYFCIQVGVTSSDCRIVCLIAYYTVHVLSSCRIPIHPTGMECCSCFWSLNILPSKDIFQTYAIETTSRLRVVHQSCYSSK